LSKGSGSTPASSPSEGSPEKGKQKRKQVGVATKVLMVKDVSAGIAVHEAADKWGVKIWTAYGIWKKRDSLLSCLEGSSHFAARKRLTTGRYPLLDAAVSTFANRIRELRLPLRFGLLQAECKKQAVAMGMTGFSASAGWVSRWLKRSGFGGFVRLHGEGGSVDEDLIAEEMERVRSELAPFHPDNIYNEDESGLTYQCLPTGTYLSLEESYKTARGTKAMKNKALNNSGHTLTLLEALKMGKATPEKTPMASGVKLTKTGGRLLSEGNRYAELVGSLLYLSTTTRPDIAFAVGVLSRFMACPEEDHMRVAKGVLRYLRGKTRLGVVYSGSEPLQGFVDADWAGRRSTTGYVFTCNGGAIAWASKRQSTVATSTAEAEYVAAAMATKEALWLRKLLSALGVDGGTVAMGEDN